MRRAITIAVVAASAVLGCGGDGEADSDSVREASLTFFETIASDDTTLSDCAELVVSGSQAERTQEAFSATGGDKPGGCGYGMPIGRVPEITEVSVNGRTATITAESGRSSTGMLLRRVDGEWLVEHPAIDP